jgi:endoglucanase
LAHPDVFAWLGAFSSAPNTKPPAELLPDPARAKELKLLWLSCGSKDGLINISQAVHAYLKQNDVPHVWNVDGFGHDGSEWKANLYQFAQRIFRSPSASSEAVPPAQEKMTPIDAWGAVAQMTPGINIGNTLESTSGWETGWGNPPITKEYVQSLARLGFKTVRLPVAWDTYADNGRITSKQFARVAEVVDWITDAGMYCVLNIHWDGGWIDSDDQKRFGKTYHTFSPEAERKFRSYWEQISRFFAGKNEKLIFEAFNEESTFSNEGSEEKAYAALARVNQLFVDTVRQTGGNNANRLLIVAGYTTDIDKTCRREFRMPKDTVPGKLFISIHYYTPWQFVGLNEDASWGKMIPTWGSADNVKQLNQLFDRLNDFCARNDTPAFIGEFSMCSNKELPSRRRWMNAVATAAIERKMVPVVWDTGGGVSRRAPYAPSEDLSELLRNMKHLRAASAPAAE